MSLWGWYHQYREDITPLLAPLGSLIVGFGTVVVGGLVARAALRQAWTAIRQAQITIQVAETANRQVDIALQRHEAQTKADLQRRITETFSMGVEHLGSEKDNVRVAGIYTLERLAREALDSPEQIAGFSLYWTVMEILATFVRINAKWPKETAIPARSQSQIDSRVDEVQSDVKPGADIAAVLDVIRRRPETGRNREKEHRHRFDLRATDLQGGDLHWSDLEWTDFAGANLRNAEFTGVKLGNANLQRTDLRGANLGDDEVFDKAEDMAILEVEAGYLTFAYLMTRDWAKTLLGAPFKLPPADRRALVNRSYFRWTDLMADLSEASLVQADLPNAKLGGACLREADLRGAKLGNAKLTAANLCGADLRGADLRGADLKGADLKGAYLSAAKFAGAKLDMVELRGANLTEAHFEGADLTRVPLDGIFLNAAYGDAKTRLPRGVVRPELWPPETPDTPGRSQ